MSVPLAALSERTSSHNLETGAERHLGFGFGSIQYLKHPKTGATTLRKNLNKWRSIRKYLREFEESAFSSASNISTESNLKKRKNNDPAFGRVTLALITVFY